MAITPSAGYVVDPNNPNAVIPAGTDAAVNNLNAALISGTGTSYPTSYNPNANYQGTITSAMLQPQAQIKVPPPPDNSAAYNGLVGGGTTQLDALNKMFAEARAKQDAAQQGSDLNSLFEKYLGSQSAPPSSADQYQADYNASGIAAKEQAALASKNKVDAITAQLQGKQYEYDTLIEQQMQQDAQGRGVTVGGMAPHLAAQKRAKMLEIAPLQIQALIAQAEATGNNNILIAAQNQLNTLYQIHQQDATNQYNYQKDLRDKVYAFASAAEQKRLDALQKKDDREFTQQQNDLNYARELAQKARSSGQADIVGKITGLDPKSPTYRQSLAQYESLIVDKSAALDEQLKSAQIAKIYHDLKDTGVSDPASMVAYAQQYAATGQIPTGLPKGSFGVVAQIAKETPKPSGTIVSVSTGVKPSSLSATTEGGITSLYDIVNKLDSLKADFKSTRTGFIAGLKNSVFPSETNQSYNDMRNEIVDLLARARTGAVINSEELRTYQAKLPSNFNKAFFVGPNGDKLIDDLKKSITGKLDSALTNNGTAIYGYTKVNLGGKTYTVGDIISANGITGRVLPDGSIAIINQ